MKEENTQQRILAVLRFKNGESLESICASLNKSKAWLYKWNKRYADNDASWSKSRSRRPLSSPGYIPAEVVEIVKIVRLNLYTIKICSAVHRPFTGRWRILA